MFICLEFKLYAEVSSEKSQFYLYFLPCSGIPICKYFILFYFVIVVVFKQMLPMHTYVFLCIHTHGFMHICAIYIYVYIFYSYLPIFFTQNVGMIDILSHLDTFT